MKIFVCVCRLTCLGLVTSKLSIPLLRRFGLEKGLDPFSDHELQVNDVIGSFGRFLKFYVSSTVPEDLPPTRDAFQVMFLLNDG